MERIPAIATNLVSATCPTCAQDRTRLAFRRMAQVVAHFGESYQSPRLKTIGVRLGATRAGTIPVRVRPPERFVAVIRRPA